MRFFGVRRIMPGEKWDVHKRMASAGTINMVNV